MKTWSFCHALTATSHYSSLSTNKNMFRLQIGIWDNQTHSWEYQTQFAQKKKKHWWFYQTKLFFDPKSMLDKKQNNTAFVLSWENFTTNFNINHITKNSFSTKINFAKLRSSKINSVNVNPNSHQHNSNQKH